MELSTPESYGISPMVIAAIISGVSGIFSIIISSWLANRVKREEVKRFSHSSSLTTQIEGWQKLAKELQSTQTLMRQEISYLNEDLGKLRLSLVDCEEDRKELRRRIIKLERGEN